MHACCLHTGTRAHSLTHTCYLLLCELQELAQGLVGRLGLDAQHHSQATPGSSGSQDGADGDMTRELHL